MDELKTHLQNYASKMSELLTESHLTWADFESVLADDENEAENEESLSKAD